MNISGFAGGDAARLLEVGLSQSQLELGGGESLETMMPRILASHHQSIRNLWLAGKAPKMIIQRDFRSMATGNRSEQLSERTFASTRCAW